MTLTLRWAAIAAIAILSTGPASAAANTYGLPRFEAIEVTGDLPVEGPTRAACKRSATG
ncbi:MAG: DUF2807 domain-containing protein, partial [Sphingopyxis sp.]|nr:DUF2807 domain-containing protein [Sphingopyxis sp.]